MKISTAAALFSMTMLPIGAALADTTTTTPTSVPSSYKTDTTMSTTTTTELRSDAAITTDVKGAFLKEKLFGDADVSAFSISVETKEGIVYLTGTADNQTQADNAVTLAKGVEGVKSVVSDVKIKVAE